MRALIVTRLSRVTDATTSPERQRAACQQLCDQRSYVVVGEATDLDVSGAVDPFDRKKRPNLARWLHDSLDEFDVLVAYRVDRLTRSVRHLQQLVNWADDHGKLVVSATEAHFDTTSPFAAVLIALLGTVAEMELEAIRERATSAARHNTKAGKYRGGTPPWGYLPTKETGEWRLKQDPVQVAVINEVVSRVLAGEPLRAIAFDLTDRRAMSPADRFNQHRGRPIQGYIWHSTTLKRLLTARTLLGQIETRTGVLRGDDGAPIVRCEPILSRETFDRLAVELATRSKHKEPTKRTSALLLQVIFCKICGRPAYRADGGKGRSHRYRCGSIQYREPCGNGSVLQPKADQAIERLVLGMLGESERLERVWDAGSDHSAELTELDAELVDLTNQLGTPEFKAGTPQRVRLNQRITELAARQAELSAEAVKPAGWTWEPTGERFGDWWAAQNVQARNGWLRRMGVRVEFTKPKSRAKAAWYIDLGDVFKLTEHLSADGTVVGWQKLFDAMQESGAAGIEIAGEDYRIVPASE